MLNVLQDHLTVFIVFIHQASSQSLIQIHLSAKLQNVFGVIHTWLTAWIFNVETPNFPVKIALLPYNIFKHKVLLFLALKDTVPFENQSLEIRLFQHFIGP